jgi:hypothetical protein
VHGTLYAATEMDVGIFDYQLRNLLDTNLPFCNKKLLVLTQCFGGNMVDDFANVPNVAVASATSDGEQSYYGYYDEAASIALYNESGRTAQDLHNEAMMNHHALESPISGGGLPLSQFPLDLFGQPQRNLHILFYAGRPADPDVSYLMTIRERNPLADIVVVSSGLLQSQSNFPATYDGLRDALATIEGRMTGCDDQFVMFASDHGGLYFGPDRANTLPPGQTSVPTPALPSSLGGILQGTADPHTYFVFFIPLYGTGITVDADGSPPLFAPGAWSISIPTSTGPQAFTVFTQIPLELGGDAIVGDDPGEGVFVRFEIPVQTFIDAFVGHTNSVTITNNDPRTWSVEIALDPGPIPPVLPPTPCVADFDDGTGTGTRDGGVGIEDLLYYLTLYDTGVFEADVDDGSGTGTLDGGVGIEDLLYYLQRYDAGC